MDPGKGGQKGANKPVGLMILFTLLIQVFVLSLGFILLPLWYFKRQSLRVGKKWRLIGYFSMLGLSYMLLEISLMQKFILFLGYPSYSISVILVGLLVSSGLGCLASGYLRMELKKVMQYSLIGIVIINLLYLFILTPLFRECLALSLFWRVLISFALLVPLGFLMGIPFPTGLKVLEGGNKSFAPWAWGVNGAASVLASVLAIILAMPLGFRAVAVIASLCYLFAVFILPQASKEE